MTSSALQLGTPLEKLRVISPLNASPPMLRLWMICGTRLPSLLTSTRMVRLMLMSSRRPSMTTASERITVHSPQDVITRGAYCDVAEIDNAYNSLVTDADKAAGGITLARYEALYAEFLGSADETNAKFLFGPLKEL